MITKEEVQHIAKLARIQLSPEEVEKFQKELGEVLDYFEILREVDVSSVQPMTHSVPLQNVKRKDEAQPDSKGRKLLDAAPEHEAGYLKVKSILT